MNSPQHGVTADEGDGTVPSVGCHREVERCDASNHPEGVPVLQQHVFGTWREIKNTHKHGDI